MNKLVFNKRKLASLLLIAFVSVAAHAQQGSTTVTGEVLDMACYMKSGAHGDGHKDCAAMCINGGSPMGILTSDNKVYLLVANHDKAAAYDEAKKHPGEQVTVTGTVSQKNGINAIIADDVKAKM
jgi:hypothetical protein